MTYFPKFAVSMDDSPSVDAFGRLRVSEPFTLFNSKLLHDNRPRDWDEALTGAGGSATHSAPKARVSMAVSNVTTGSVTRQSFNRFNYQSGKSQVAFFTGNVKGLVADIVKRIGLFDDDDGLFFEFTDAAKIITRTSTTGSPVDTAVAQASWNLDVLDGSGPSGFTIDWTKTQIWVIDFEWLGVGRIRFGLVLDGVIVHCHEVLNSNSLADVYMSTPNLPARYSISNAGSGVAATLEQMCTTVMSEGGVEEVGVVNAVDSGGALTLGSGVVNGIFGIRLASDALDSVIHINSYSMISTGTNDIFRIQFILDPTVAGTPTWDTTTYPTVDISTGTPGTHTVTGGTVLLAEFGGGRGQPLRGILPPSVLGSLIDGTAQEIWMVVTAFGAVTGYASLNWGDQS